MSSNNQEEGCLMEFFYGIGLILLIIGVVLSLTGVGAIVGLPVIGVGYIFSHLAKGVVKLGKGIDKAKGKSGKGIDKAKSKSGKGIAIFLLLVALFILSMSIGARV
jgi:hypothetical protein